MYQLIDKNKRRSWLLIFIFSLLILGIGWLLSYAVEGGYFILIIAVVFNLISVLISYYAGDKLVLSSVGAKQIQKNDDPELFRTVENLAITAGVPMPKVYLIPDQALNAFATGRDPNHASVAITKGLRRTLSKAELEAVMAHELSHVKNYDIRVMVITAILFGMIVFMADMLWRLAFSGRSRNKNAGLIMIPIIIAAAILAPLAAQMIKLAVSRKREFLADASSVMLTRYPQAMISALQKISRAPNIAGHNEAIAHLFIFPPIKKSLLAKLFSTHPPIEERITAIEQGSGFARTAPGDSAYTQAKI